MSNNIPLEFRLFVHSFSCRINVSESINISSSLNGCFETTCNGKKNLQRGKGRYKLYLCRDGGGVNRLIVNVATAALRAARPVPSLRRAVIILRRVAAGPVPGGPPTAVFAEPGVADDGVACAAGVGCGLMMPTWDGSVDEHGVLDTLNPPRVVVQARNGAPAAT